MPAVPFPGSASPAAGFDHPFELLAACHERVRQRLGLLARLIDHLDAHGVDAAAREAASDVLRYFDIAAPHHHEDEERHLVPRLQASAEPAHQAAAQRLLADHAALRSAWAALRPGLLVPAARDAALRQAATHFIALHGPHLELEDTLAYPAAMARITAEEALAMGQDMAARRGARLPIRP